jgi:hypothetical protein
LADPDVEWEQRRLCPDGACIGVVGGDGRCKVCGALAPETGGPFRATAIEAADEDDDEAPMSANETPVAVVEGGASTSASSSEGFDDERELCPDDACIGLIGPDGRCKVCGKPRG